MPPDMPAGAAAGGDRGIRSLDFLNDLPIRGDDGGIDALGILLNLDEERCSRRPESVPAPDCQVRISIHLE